MATSDAFLRIGPSVGAGDPPPTGWTLVTACECLILVGLTGVGKTTALEQLARALPGFLLLPDRRALTDLLMIPFVQRRDGLAVEPVTDRSLRFDYTRRYRQMFPGGMAYAMSQLSVSPEAAAGLVVFDGLRGENEVRHAAELMPHARFLMLDTPDLVRIQRLVTRRDAFDAVTPPAGTAGADESTSLASLGVGELAEILGETEQRELLRWVQDGEASGEELAAKARIVLAERRNYDPDATRAALAESAAGRTLVVDTSLHSPEEIARRTARWLAV